MRHYFYILAAFICIISACNDAEVQPKEYPLIVTKEVTDIDTEGATLEAEILVPGTAKITDFGFIVTDGAYTLKQSVFNSTKFKKRMTTDLKPNVVYVCKAYLTTAKTLVYGNSVTFLSKGSTSPLISYFSPKTGFDGDTVTLIGKHFSLLLGNDRIYINKVPAQIISGTDSSIVFITPNQSFVGAADVTIEVNTMKVTSAQKFTLVGPQINSISSLSETSGKVVTINGTNLIRNGRKTAINFGQYNATILNQTNNRIDVVVPIATINLLDDNYTTVKLTNGFKTLTYPSDFLIKKSWKSKSPPLLFNFPTTYQDGFAYNGKGYMHDVDYGNMYEYNPATDSWKQFGTTPFPATTRYTKSLYIQSNDQVFRVGGTDYLSLPVNSLWSYNLVDNKWTKKNNLPFSFSNAGYFTLDNQIYILTYEKQLWQCDFENEQYKRLNDFPGKIVDYFISTFIANGNAYAVHYGETWLYDKQNDSWIPKSSNPFFKANYSVFAKCFTYNNTGYVLNNGTNLYKYDFVNDVWVLASKYPNVLGSNSDKSIFLIGNEVYIADTFSNYQAGAPFMYLYME